MPTGILKELVSGNSDPQAVGQIVQVAEKVEANPTLLSELFEGAISPNSLLRMRAAIVISRVAHDHPEYVDPFRMRLLMF